MLLSASLGVAGPECLNPGPDLIVRDIFDAYSYGSVGDRAAFAVGTDACNIGDVVHDWYGETSNHPVIDSALYRLHDGRFEQIGMAWLKHGFGAAQEDTCGCDCIPGDWEHLGVGCSDAYNAQTNGIQGICGSRLEVNPWTGVFPFPPSGWGASGDTVFRRLQASHSDLDPVVFVGAEYVTEAHYVAPADAAAGNQRNNYSTRSATFDYSGDRWNMSLHGETSVGQPAVRTWQAMDSEVVVTEVEGKTGRVLIGARVHAEPGGWYRYEYAVQNLDDARGVRAMVVPCNSAATILDPQFTDVDYHSDDPIVGTDWPVVLDADAIAWSTDTWLRDPQANAIRWGTTYSFGFRANIDPAEGEVQLTYFTTGSPASVMVSTLVPRLDAVDPCTLPSGSCPRDLNGDLMAGVDDLLIVLETWGQCGDGTWQPGGDVDQDCCVTVDDILELLVGWGEDCRPRGACCLVDGGCDGDVLEADCDAAGGTWRGVGVSCFDAGCPEPGGCCFGDASCVEDLLPDDCHAAGGLHLPSGAGCADCPLMADACIDAVPIGDGHHAFDTTGATTDGPVHLECDTFDGGVTGNDIWMRYASPADGVLVLSTCNTANYDSDLVVYDGVDCENLVLLGCNDDTEGCEGWTSYLEVPVLADGEYLVRLGGWQEDSTGTGVLDVMFVQAVIGACCMPGGFCQEVVSEVGCVADGGLWMGDGTLCADVLCAPPNDDCADAVPIVEGVHPFDTRMATTDGPTHPECDEFDGGVTGNDIWFYYTAPAVGTLLVSTCSTANYDTDLVVYDGVDCDDLAVLGCDDDTEGCEGYTSYVEVPVTEGSAYLIRLGGWQETHVGTGTLLIEFAEGG